MATVDQITFTIIYVTPIHDLLRSARGTDPTTQSGFVRLGDHPHLTHPWALPTGHWSRFWSNYLRAGRLAKIGSAQLWAFGVPFEVTNPGSFNHPSPTVSTSLRTLIYPAAVCTLLTVTSTTATAVADAADHVAMLSRARDFTMEGASRSLPSIAAQITAKVIDHFLTPTSSMNRIFDPYSVASVIAASGPGEALSLAKATTQQTLAGFADLSEPGVYQPDRLIVASNPQHSGRMYLTGTGLGIWRERPTADAIRDGVHQAGWTSCMHRNQVELRTHIGALLSALSWADDARKNQSVTPNAVPYVRDVVCQRLQVLNEGDRYKTYRSTVAKRMIDPHLDKIRLLLDYLP